MGILRKYVEQFNQADEQIYRAYHYNEGDDTGTMRTLFDIVYDKKGDRYGVGKGLNVTKKV